MSSDKLMRRLLDAQAMRQQALDYLAVNEWAIGPDIIKALGWKLAPGASRLDEMTACGELEREPTICRRMNVLGFEQQQRTYKYRAKVKTTKRAEDVLAKIRECGKALGASCKTKASLSTNSKTIPPWVTRNTDENRPPIQNQGGQGRASPRLSSMLDGCFL